MAYDCEICKDKGLVKNKEGKDVLCVCKLKKTWDTVFSPFMSSGRIPKPTAEMKKFIDEVIDKEGRRGEGVPNKYYLTNTKDNDFGRINGRDYYRSFFTYYLIKTKLFMDMKIMPFYYIIDLYMGKANQGIRETELEETFYALPYKTFVIYFENYIKNAVLYSILEQFLDLYKDRNILFYLDTAAYYKCFPTFNDSTNPNKYTGQGSLEIKPILESRGLVDIMSVVDKSGIIV